MTPDVVAVDLGQDAPGLEASVYRLVTRADVGLLPLVGDGVTGVVGAFNLVGGANVAVVGFDALAGLEEVTQDLVEDLDVVEGAGGVGALYPNEVPPEDTHPDLVSEGRLPRVLVGREGVPPDRSPRLRDPEVRPVDGHEAVVAHVPLLSSLKVDLRWRRVQGEERGAGVS